MFLKCLIILLLFQSKLEAFNKFSTKFDSAKFNARFGSLSPKISRSYDSDRCESQLNSFSDAFVKRENWALRMFDTWSKINSGYFSGNHFDFGHFTECMKFRHDTKSPTWEIISGQHCFIGFAATPNSTITNIDSGKGFDWRELGEILRNEDILLIKSVCLPATCSPPRILQFINEFLLQADLMALGIECTTNDSLPIETFDIIAISIFSFFILLLIISTIYDILMTKSGKEPNKLLTAFSVLTNGRNLFDMSPSISPNSIECLHGIRALSVFWIMFGHRLGNQLGFPLMNSEEVMHFYDQIYSVIFTAYNLAVDTFFVMGALLITRSTLVALDRKKLNIPRMILHRYLRYTPTFAALILYMISIAKFTYSGPITIDELSQNCRHYWWSSILHIQNYVNPNDLCLGHAWYLSADFQLFVLSPFLIYPAWRFGNRYIWFWGLLAMLSSIYILVISLVMQIYVLPRNLLQGELYSTWIYYPTHARIGPWFVGMILGYIMYRCGNRKINIPKKIESSLWIFALSLMTTILLIQQPLNANIENNQTTLLANALAMAFSRLVWAIALSWIIFACHNLKSGGIIRWFLALNEFKPIGKMGLSIYLVHVVYQVTTIINQKQTFYFEILPMMQIYWGDILVSIVLGSFMYFTFEVPFLHIEDYFYKKFNSNKLVITKNVK